MEIPTEVEVLEIVKVQSSALQFKNSLKYIQGGTNVNLERMIERFDVVLAQVYLDGVQKGLQIAKSQVMEPIRAGGFTPAKLRNEEKTDL